MGSLTGFNADKERTPAFEPIPEDWHQCIAIECERKDTKNRNNDDWYLNFTIEFQDAPFKGRRVWVMFNLGNSSDAAKSRARAEFAGFCRAVNVLTPDEPEDLLYKPFRALTFNEEYNGNLNAKVKEYGASSATAPARPVDEANEFLDGADDGAPWDKR